MARAARFRACVSRVINRGAAWASKFCGIAIGGEWAYFVNCMQLHHSGSETRVVRCRTAVGVRKVEVLEDEAGGFRGEGEVERGVVDGEEEGEALSHPTEKVDVGMYSLDAVCSGLEWTMFLLALQHPRQNF